MRTAVLFAVATALSSPLGAQQAVPLPAFDSVELRGGGEVIIVPGAVQRVILLSGSTAVTALRVDRMGKLRIDVCNGRCPANYRLRVQIVSPRVPAVGIKGGGSIRAASGFAPQSDLAAGIAGGGSIDLRAVDARTVAAGVSGGGLIRVRARETLTAGVSGGGEVRYVGNPQVTMGVRGGGDVHRDN
jgi:hypothetical protein